MPPPDPPSWPPLRARAAALGAALAAGPPPAGGAGAWRGALARAVDALSAAVAAADGGRDDRLLVAVCDLRAAVAAKAEGEGGAVARPQPPPSLSPPPSSPSARHQTFDRDTTKFFCAPGAEGRLRLALAARLPLSGAPRARRLGFPRGGAGDALDPAVNSIYFDDAELTSATARAARADGAAAVRVRWYGGGGGVPRSLPSSIWLERKIHRVPPHRSIKERCALPPAALASMLAGDPPPSLPPLALELAPRLAACAPVLRTTARRTAFGAPGGNVRVTLDESVEFAGEEGGWRWPPRAARAAARSPAAVLEVKLAADVAPPSWLAALTSDTSLVTPAKYSKFVAGVAAVGACPRAAALAASLPPPPECVRAPPPPSPVDAVIDVEAAADPPPPPPPKRKRWPARWRPRSRAAVAPLPLAPPARAEPKSFFANERTLLSWIQIAVLILLLSTSLVTGGGGGGGGAPGAGDCSTAACRASALAGAAVAPVAVLLMAYALAVHRSRTRKLLARAPARWDDARGPAALVALAAVAGVATLVAAFSRAATAAR